MRSLPGLIGRRRIIPATPGCQPVPHVIARCCFRGAAHTWFQSIRPVLDLAQSKLHAREETMIDSGHPLARRTVLGALGIGGLGAAPAAPPPAPAPTAIAPAGGGSRGN